MRAQRERDRKRDSITPKGSRPAFLPSAVFEVHLAAGKTLASTGEWSPWPARDRSHRPDDSCSQPSHSTVSLRSRGWQRLHVIASQPRCTCGVERAARAPRRRRSTDSGRRARGSPSAGVAAPQPAGARRSARWTRSACFCRLRHWTQPLRPLEQLRRRCGCWTVSSTPSASRRDLIPDRNTSRNVRIQHNTRTRSTAS